MDKYSGPLEEAKRYAEENFSNNEISLNTVASHVGISPSYFSTIFRQETGQTFIAVSYTHLPAAGQSGLSNPGAAHP